MREPSVHAAIAAVMREVGAVGKDDVNQQQKFHYRSIDALINALSPVMAKHGVFVVPMCANPQQDERVTKSGTAQVLATIEYRFRVYGPTGDFVEGCTIGQGLDMSDKALNKAMTAGYKYAVAQVFAIAYAGVDEGDAETLERGAANTSPQVTTEDVKARIEKATADLNMDIESTTGKFRAAHGNLTVDQMWDLPVETLYGFARQIVAYAQQQQKAPHTEGAPA
jgi:ERF superfamily